MKINVVVIALVAALGGAAAALLIATHLRSEPAQPNTAAAHVNADARSLPNLDGRSRAALEALAFTMSDTAAALAADNLPRYESLRGVVRESIRVLAQVDKQTALMLSSDVSNPLPERQDIAAARRDFARLSSAVVDMVRATRLVQQTNLRIFECTMVPEVGRARWLQRDADAKNPFFGAAMLTCGAELNSGVTARALPAGHPPIDHLSVAQKAEYGSASGTGPAASAGCGGCSMSQEAVAAGEACEHDKKK